MSPPTAGRALALLGSAAAIGCGPQPTTPRATFEAEVVPVIERSCASSSCHGVAPGAEADGEVIDWELFFFDIDSGGGVADLDQLYEASLRTINTEEAPEFSSLLRKPLANAYGGLPHYGGENFPSTRGDDYQAICDWILQESEGGEVAEPLDEYEQRFADEVQPVLFGMGCANANCHGVEAAVPFRFDPGVAGEVSIEGSRSNYHEALSMLSLDGDPEQSRLARKALPLHDGGIVHKGGNVAFLDGLDDPRMEILRGWACDERQRLVGRDCDGPEIEGFVFVRGRVSPAHPFELDTYEPGTDIFLARAGAGLQDLEITNLTGALHDGGGDARDPAVDPSGERLLFSMRLSADTGHELYVMELGTGEVTQLTWDSGPLDGGGLSTNRDPTWGPAGKVWYVSTRAGVVADAGALMDADIYELDMETGERTRHSWTPHVERKPVFFVSAHTGGEVDFSVLRDAIPGQARAHPFRFPPSLKTEYHQHFGITPVEDLFFDTRELADGRFVAVIGDLDAAWVGGTLGIIDRNFGAELNEAADSQDPALPFYAPPRVIIDPEGVTPGAPGTLYRDPAALPDGRLLAAFAPDMDLLDPDQELDLGIAVLTVEEAADGSGPAMVDRVTLVDEPGVSDFDPEPIYARRPAPAAAAYAWDPEASTGRLNHQGLPMIDALLGNLYPSGEKIPRDDFRYVRLIEAIPTTPEQRVLIPAEETRDGVEGATSVSLGTHGPARVLAELELAEDGTFQAEIPAGVAWRIQGLNEDRMAVGVPHNRWFDLHPGQVMPQGISGVNPSHYASRCAACHGAADGDPASVFIEPDVMTTASLTLSRYQDQNLRRPIAPPLTGDETRLEVDFQRDVQPILDTSCAAGCHEGADPAGGLSLTDAPTAWFNDAYETLLADGDASGAGKAWVNEPDGSAVSSYLVELLTGRELEAPGSLARPGVPHPEELGEPALDEEALLTVIRWIDLGATWTGGTP